MQRRERGLQGWMLAALALGVVSPIACGGRSALDDRIDDRIDDGIGEELGAGTGGTRFEPSTGGSARGGSGGRRGGSAGAAGAGGTTLAGTGGAGVSGAAGAAVAGSAGAAMSGSGGAAGASVAGAAGSGGSGSSPSVALSGCSTSAPLEGGFSLCESGLLHRPRAGETCSNPLPRASAFEPVVLFELEQLARDAGYLEAELASLYRCREDTDCTERANGYCDLASPDGWSPGSSFTACRYACSSDADCGGGTLCQCGEPAASCVSATCIEDSECGEGLLCAAYDPRSVCNSGPAVAWECQRRDDHCSVDAHCSAGQVCRLVDGRRTCTSPLCN